MKNRDVNLKTVGINKKNAFGMLLFLILIGFTLVLKFATSAIIDGGYQDGKFHWGYIHDHAAKLINGHADADKVSGLILNSDTSWDHDRPSQNPSVFWNFTQFEWLLCIATFTIILGRYLRLKDLAPLKIRWVSSQHTLSLITMYGVVISGIYWGYIFNWSDIMDNFPSDPLLKFSTMGTTGLVHIIIPILLICFTLHRLTHSPEASRLRSKYLVLGVIWPTIYIIYYIIINYLWRAPYTKIDLRDNFGQIWKLILFLVILYCIFGVLLIIHNLILFRFNKRYMPTQDYDLKRREMTKIVKVQKRINRKEDVAQHKKFVEETVIESAKNEADAIKVEREDQAPRQAAPRQASPAVVRGVSQYEQEATVRQSDAASLKTAAKREAKQGKLSAKERKMAAVAARRQKPVPAKKRKAEPVAAPQPVAMPQPIAKPVTQKVAAPLPTQPAPRPVQAPQPVQQPVQAPQPVQQPVQAPQPVAMPQPVQQPVQAPQPAVAPQPAPQPAAVKQVKQKQASVKVKKDAFDISKL